MLYAQLKLTNTGRWHDVVLRSGEGVEVLRPGEEVVMDLEPGKPSDPITIGAGKQRDAPGEG